MVDTGTTSTATLCDSCKTTPSTIYCNAESTFLCANCDTTIHRLAANRHPRVLVCEVCEEVPAVVMCKADDAALCATCDYDVHSANNLAHRHERIPIVPLSHVADTNSSQEEKEAEAATWLLPDPNNNNNNNKLKDESGSPRYYPCDDIVVPEQNNNKNEYGSGQHPDHVVDVVRLGSKPMMICSPTVLMDNVLERNIVRDDMKNKGLSGFEREERVLRYREKRKYRKFIKTIRYTSRKAYAEIRPRINGRFAKRSKADCIDSLGATRDSSED